MAAALAAGPGAVVSHAGAAAFHRLNGLAAASHVPELIVPRDRYPRLSGVVVHRCGPLSPQDRPPYVGHWRRSRWPSVVSSSQTALDGLCAKNRQKPFQATWRYADAPRNRALG